LKLVLSIVACHDHKLKIVEDTLQANALLLQGLRRGVAHCVMFRTL